MTTKEHLRKLYMRVWIAGLGGYLLHLIGRYAHSDAASVIGVIAVFAAFPLWLRARVVRKIYENEMLRERARMEARWHYPA